MALLLLGTWAAEHLPEKPPSLGGRGAADVWFSTSGEPLPLLGILVVVRQQLPPPAPASEVDPLTLPSSLKFLHSLYSQPASSLLLHRKMNQLARSSSNCSLAAYIHPDDPSSCPWKRGSPGARDPIFARFLEHLQFPTNMPTSHSCFKTNNILPISPAAPLTTLSFLLFVHFFKKNFFITFN